MKFWKESLGIGSGAETHQQAERNNDDAPGDAKDHRETVEVALGDAGGAEAGAHAAAEHVGQAAAASLVQQDEHGQQEAGDAQQHLQDDMKNVHDGLSEEGIAGAKLRPGYSVSR